MDSEEAKKKARTGRGSPLPPLIPDATPRHGTLVLCTATAALFPTTPCPPPSPRPRRRLTCSVVLPKRSREPTGADAFLTLGTVPELW